MEFYRSTLQYLTYTPVDTLSSEEQCEIARDICLAALAADSIFTFGELVALALVTKEALILCFGSCNIQFSNL